MSTPYDKAAQPFTDDDIDQAYTWLCKRRAHFPPNTDIWHLRFHWVKERRYILDNLQSGKYRLSPLSLVRKANGEVIHIWAAKDALVLKMLASVLADRLPVSNQCTHIKGHGGLKWTVRQIHQKIPDYQYVLRTDIKGYYANIDHFELMDKLAEKIKDKRILNLLWQYMRRCVERGGLYRDIQRGISRGCPLSPLIGGFYLTKLDEQFINKDLYYVRYMDDILILTRTRWKLRSTVKTLNECLREHKLKKHPDKTFIGRLDRGFDFLGYQFSTRGLTVARKTITRFIARLHRLYEQKKAAPDVGAILGDYVRRWLQWVFAGLKEVLAGRLYRQLPAFVT